jgi:hypothetical protein
MRRELELSRFWDVTQRKLVAIDVSKFRSACIFRVESNKGGLGLFDPEGEATNVLRNGKYLPIDMWHREISLREPHIATKKAYI